MVIDTSALIAILLGNRRPRRWRGPSLSGKGRHPAGLNIGDCCSYAVARHSGEPLLFVGDDFSRTDVTLVRY